MRAPVYSHLIYDIMPIEWIEIDRPDILIVEGLNVLQAGRLPKDGKAVPFVSDFFDFSVYLDAKDRGRILSWYVNRFLTLRGTAFAESEIIFFIATLNSPTRRRSPPADLDLEPHQSAQSASRIFCRRGSVPISS